MIAFSDQYRIRMVDILQPKNSTPNRGTRLDRIRDPVEILNIGSILFKWILWVNTVERWR